MQHVYINFFHVFVVAPYLFYIASIFARFARATGSVQLQRNSYLLYIVAFFLVVFHGYRIYEHYAREGFRY